MLANSPKDNPSSPVESCALYYFPEIPGRIEKERSAGSNQGQFVGGALNPNCDGSSPNAHNQNPEQIRELAEEAFNKGVAQGRAEAMTAQQKNLHEATVALTVGVEELVRIRQRDLDRMETETVRLSLAIAKKVIGYETEHGQVIESVVKAALKKVADTRHLTVRLNPKDIETVRGIQQELLKADDFGAILRCEADETILQGGCIIETKLGDVDARIDQQVKIIETLLSDHLPKHSEPDRG